MKKYISISSGVRRKFLFRSLALVGLAVSSGCEYKKWNQPHRGSYNPNLQPSIEEMEFLQDFKLRQTKLSGNLLIIHDTVFGRNVRFDPFHWENTQFINCDFIHCLMLKGVLKNVHFENCTFKNIKFEESSWDNVSFLRCTGRGNFTMVADSGKNVLFDDCEFIGSTPEQLGYGGKSDSFGGIGGTDGEAIYRKCHLERMVANGGSSLQILDCKLIDVFGSANYHATLLIQNIEGKGTVDFSGSTSTFSNVTVKDSTFEGLTFRECTIENGIFEKVKADLDLGIVHASNFELRNITFVEPKILQEGFKYGLDTESAKIKKLLIENCLLSGKQVALNLSGTRDLEKNDASGNIPEKKHINVFSTTIEELTIRNTPIIRGRLEYMEIGKLLLENLTVQSANFSHGEFNQFILRNVALTGVVDFTDTKIKERIFDRVENTSTGTQPTLLKQ